MLSRHKSSSAAALMVSLALLLAACAPAAAPSAPAPAAPQAPAGAAPAARPAPSPTAIPGPKRGGTLRGVMTEVTASWNRFVVAHGPASQATWWLYPALVMDDYFAKDYVAYFPNRSTSKRIPYLAEKWESPNPITYIFTLRKGVKWENREPTNGRELTSDDVVFTFQKGLESPQSYKEGREPISKIEAPDAYTVKFTLKRPYSTFIEQLSTIDFMVYPKEQYAKLDSWENHRSAGPWVLVKYERGVGATYARNPNYTWYTDPRFSGQKPPYLDGAEMLVIPDIKSKVAALRTGKIDILTTSDLSAGIPSDDFTKLKQDMPQLQYNQFWTIPGQTNMRTDQKPFSDVRVRRAISMAIDRDAQVQGLTFGEGDPQRAVVGFPGAPFRLSGKDLGPAAQWYEYNPKRAKELMAEAGYPNGFKTQYTTSAQYRSQGYTDVMQSVSAYLSAIGIETEQREIEHAQWASTVLAGKYDGLGINIGSFVGSVDENLGSYVGGRNPSHVTDPKLRELYERFFLSTSEAQKKAVAEEAQRYLADQVYQIVHPVRKSKEAWWPHVKGYDGQAPRWGFGIYAQFIWLEK